MSPFERYLEKMSRVMDGFRRNDGLLRISVEPECFSVKLEFVEYTMSLASYIPANCLMELFSRRHEIVDVRVRWNGGRELYFVAEQEYAYQGLVAPVMIECVRRSGMFGIFRPNVRSLDTATILECEATLNFDPAVFDPRHRQHAASCTWNGLMLSVFCAQYLLATYVEDMPMMFNDSATHNSIGHA